MTAREILNKWRATDKALKELQGYIGLHATPMTGMPHGTKISKPTEMDAIWLASLPDEINKMFVFVMKVESSFSCLTMKQERVIRMRYKARLSLEEVAKRNGIDLKNVQEIEYRALSALEQEFKKEGLIEEEQ